MKIFVRAQVSDRRETPRVAKKISTGRILPALFFEHDAEIGQKDHFGQALDKPAWRNHIHKPQKTMKVGHCGMTNSQVLRLLDTPFSFSCRSISQPA